MYLTGYAITVVPFFFLPFLLLCPAPPSLQHSPLLSSCPWAIHTSSLASPFPILFLISPYPYFVSTNYAYSLYIPCTFSSILPLPFPAFNPPCDAHFCVQFCTCSNCLFLFFLGSVDSSEFVIILLFIVLIVFFLDKSL
ncbi:hypothetical protein HJG60_007966 [Phyllostomus discolor]|uniref:Uncharacterized protein n=1 Tax=Phyllostomus discolor TaxID=89673 RepID=A0A834ERT2_9CHIR|nr:hypothetical protein HJG60_007966 [Phyllostomus discolor]